MVFFSRILVPLTLSLTTLISPQAWSADFLSPRTAALGGAGHAGPLLNDSLFLNPAYISFVPANNVSVNYLSYNGGADTLNPNSGRNYNVGIQDGQNPLF